MISRYSAALFSSAQASSPVCDPCCLALMYPEPIGDLMAPPDGIWSEAAKQPSHKLCLGVSDAAMGLKNAQDFLQHRLTVTLHKVPSDGPWLRHGGSRQLWVLPPRQHYLGRWHRCGLAASLCSLVLPVSSPSVILAF